MSQTNNYRRSVSCSARKSFQFPEMDLILAIGVAMVVSLQEVDGHSAREGKSEASSQIECIYHNMEHVNCKWKPNEEAAHGVNDQFFYWFTKEMHVSWCSPIEGKQRCELIKRKNISNWLCLYIDTSDNQTVMPMNCLQLQEHGPHRLVLNKTGPSDLDCLYSDDNYLNCSWEQDKDKRQNINYYVYYMFSRRVSVKQCQQYLRDGSRNVGCHLTVKSATADYKWLYVYVMDNNHVTRVRPQKFLLGDHVKMNPPQILTAKLTGKEEILLEWDKLKNRNSYFLQYEMKYKSNLDSDWQTELIHDLSFRLPNVDPAKCYFFHLRSMIYENYATGGHWSDWGPILIWKEKTVVDSCPSPRIKALFLVLLPVAILVLVIFVCVLYRVKRVRILVLPGIPDPKHVFIDLFDDHNGNFQEWIGVSKDLHMDCQSNCSPVECQIEEDSMGVNIECEDSPVVMTGSTEPAQENINGSSENSGGDTPTSQLLVQKPATIDMSKFVMDGSAYIRL
ncbi:cytokine receptor common subunit gamma-like [Pristis pectinata]|uniref:cytokine receptor common subunit gamma-like n=1 Tax=Pristis pectinata TaxID=685728 RepID=UPI00223D9097|nr:cytokine receptor common subunit gamma-like [Pristis pectinata]